MGHTFTDRRLPPKSDVRTKTPRQRFTLAMRPFLLAAIPVALAVYYFAWVAPTLVPVSPGVKVPFLVATRFLEDAAVWCGDYWWAVLLFGIGVLVPGLLYRSLDKAERYYLRLAIAVSVILGYAYVSISTPFDRFMDAVEKNVPQDQRVPDYSNGAEQ